MAKNDKKWAFLRGKLKLEALDPSYEDVLTALRDQHAALPFDALARTWNAAEVRKAELKEALSEQDAIITVCERLAYTRMERESMEVVTLEGVRLSRTEEPTAKVEDSEVYLAWIRGEAMDDYLSVHPSRTLSLVKAELAKGAACVLPPGVDVSFRPIVNRTKA